LTPLDVLGFVLGMASIHKNSAAGSPYWFAAYRGADGRRLKKSTKTTDRRLAMEMAVQWEKAAMAGRSGTITEVQTRKVLNEILEAATGEPLHFATVKDFFADWLKDKEGAKKTRTTQKYAPLTTSFLSSIGKRARLSLAAIGPADLRQWRSSLEKKGLSAATVNGSLRIISSAFERARRQGYIQANPCLGLESLKDEEKGEKDCFTTEQIKALLQEAKGTDWEGAILAGINTGLRRGDLTNLTWDLIDTGSKDTWFLSVKTSKRGKYVFLPVHPDLREWLESRTRGVGKAPVFPDLFGKSGSGKSGISMQFKRLMERAGVRGRVLRTGKGKGRTTTSLTLHSMRDTFISRLANAGVAEDVRMKLVAHQTKAIHRGYTHLDIDTFKSAVFSIQSLK
jgi:integrase